jgi:DNA-directed RNA polymerase specialized sigma24 family protein
MREALDTDDRLSPAEVRQEVKNMSAADRVRVERLARYIFAGVFGMSYEDLLQEAYLKLLSGERVWRRGFAAVPAITSILDSMASNYRKREKSGPIDSRTIVVTTESMEDTDLLVHNVEPVDTLTPEGVAYDAQQLKKLEALLGDDEDATLVAWEWAEGRRGREAIEALGICESQYEAARKRLLRKIETMADERRNR